MYRIGDMFKFSQKAIDEFPNKCASEDRFKLVEFDTPKVGVFEWTKTVDFINEFYNKGNNQNSPPRWVVGEPIQEDVLITIDGNSHLIRA